MLRTTVITLALAAFVLAPTAAGLAAPDTVSPSFACFVTTMEAREPAADPEGFANVAWCNVVAHAPVDILMVSFCPDPACAMEDPAPADAEPTWFVASPLGVPTGVKLVPVPTFHIALA